MKYIILIIFAGILLFPSCTTKPIKLFTAKEVQTAEGVTLLDVDQKVLKNIQVNHLKNIEVVLPSAGIAVLQEQELFTEDFVLRTDKGIQPFIQQGLHYSGKLKDNTESMVSLSISGEEVVGVISDKNGNRNLGEVGTDYGIYAQSETPFTCGTSEIPIEEKYRQRIEGEVRAAAGNCVSIDFELTYECFTQFGGVTGATNWFTQIFAAVRTVFLQEGIDAKIKSIYVWSVDDGYSDNPAQALTQLQNKRLNDPNFTGSVVHLIRVQGSAYSGIAFLDALCSPYNKAFSQLMPVTGGTSDYSWNIMVVLHETSHVLASPHTHSCTWPGGPIDGCYTQEGTCSPGPIPCHKCGTIMSYCHLRSDVQTSFAKGFGPLPKAKILDRIVSSSCTACTPAPPSPTGDPLISKGKPTAQSSNYPGYPAVSGANIYPSANVVDDNNATFQSTNPEVSPFWQVDLSGQFIISRIQITNRQDCCLGRVKNFKLYLSADLNFSVDEVVYTNTTALTNGQVIEIPMSKKGRYIKLIAENNPANYLHIAECRIYGKPSDIIVCDTFKIRRDSIVCR